MRQIVAPPESLWRASIEAASSAYAQLLGRLWQRVEAPDHPLEQVGALGFEESLGSGPTVGAELEVVVDRRHGARSLLRPLTTK
jgi:hypothetical protein